MHPEFLLIVWCIPLVLMAVSLAYFLAAARTMSWGARFATSSHGAVGALLYGAAWAIGSSGNSRFEYEFPYLISFGVPVALIFGSFAAWKGPLQIHLLQLLNLPALLLALFIGGMAITGNWL